jgi:predicted transcriptional regulator
MIVRRRKNCRFTFVPNAVFDDQHITVEDMGVLSYLLSRPDDWHFNLEWVGTKLRVSRQRMQRIFKRLAAAGYLSLEKTHDPRGHWQFEYVVRDEPVRTTASNTIEEPRAHGTPPRDENQSVANMPQDENPSVEIHPAEQERQNTNNRYLSTLRPSIAEAQKGLQVKQVEKRPNHAIGADQGMIQRHIAERIGPTVEAGFEIVFALAQNRPSELDQLCAKQRRGTLDDRTIAKLRLTAGATQ